VPQHGLIQACLRTCNLWAWFAFILENRRNGMNLLKTKEERRIFRENRKLEKQTILDLHEKLATANKYFNEKLDELINFKETLVEKQYYLRTNQEIDSRIISLEKSLYDEINQRVSELIKKLFDQHQEYVNQTNEEIGKRDKHHLESMSELENKMSEFSHIQAQQQDILNQIAVIRSTLEQFKELEKTYREIAVNTINEKLSSQDVIDELNDRTSKMILNAFNEELNEMKASEQKTIIESLKSVLINRNIMNVVEMDETRKKKLSEHAVFHDKYKMLKSILQADVIPMVVGPAGSGKSHAIEQIALELGLSFYMANRIQNTFELVGFVNAGGEYVTTQFYEAFTKGGLFFFDEVDASSPEALVTINAAVAQGYMAFPGHANNVTMHKEFKVVVAGNTYGTGATLQYTGRNKLDAATLDRFMIIEWNYDRKLESLLVKDKDLLAICWALREVSVKHEDVIISTRGIISAEKIILQEKKSKTMEQVDVFKLKFFPTTKKEKLKKIIETLSKKSFEKNPYYHTVYGLIET
jgi:cobaltochelatase CobS